MAKAARNRAEWTFVAVTGSTWPSYDGPYIPHVWLITRVLFHASRSINLRCVLSSFLFDNCPLFKYHTVTHHGKDYPQQPSAHSDINFGFHPDAFSQPDFAGLLALIVFTHIHGCTTNRPP
jgi:hypothetical protein